jgi:hypothetical protein
MASPEQSHEGRTGRTELDDRARSVPGSSGAGRFGPEPEENQPGHHPAEEQDRPPLDDFAAKFGIASDTTGEAAEAEPPPGDRPGHDDLARSEAAPPDGRGGARGRHLLPDPVHRVWAVTVRRGVLPALGGIRSATDALERVARHSIR